ncbi:hypothetical protein LshimejAT787_1900170 [Lyophyllum shimeji]|uniref:Uncharacterized protein n=1 Tax=Lyophyllum shimeji TaxID=47721 RepID=A0A9P3Q0P3_LYOSH|nr:hypothetical protein LshimejAT787_1900170 [Lyophyllum shimeji]
MDLGAIASLSFSCRYRITSLTVQRTVTPAGPPVQDFPVVPEDAIGRPYTLMERAQDAQDSSLALLRVFAGCLPDETYDGPPFVLSMPNFNHQNVSVDDEGRSVAMSADLIRSLGILQLVRLDSHHVRRLSVPTRLRPLDLAAVSAVGENLIPGAPGSASFGILASVFRQDSDRKLFCPAYRPT